MNEPSTAVNPSTPSHHSEENDRVDLLIIGGGINGAGIAADAAGRGLSVSLFEANDFASATSSASSKLIHGGLRYLEHYEFRLVSEALAEREVLLKKAPHIAWPMRFRLPHRSSLRPAWLVRSGLFLYDNLARRSQLPSTSCVNLAKSKLLHPEFKQGFEYSDCWVDDARLVVLNIRDAERNGANVHNYCRVEKATWHHDHWQVTIRNTITEQTYTQTAKVLVNAAGPWVKKVFDENLALTSPRNVRLIKGSHIVVPKIHDEPQSYILQNKDNRIVFVIPYLEHFSLIGTTDVEHQGDAAEAKICEKEIDYLVDVVNQHFVSPISADDVVWSFSGVRPLCDKEGDDESNPPQAITRDYTLEMQANGEPAVLSVFGGKITTYRKLAEAALNKLEPLFPNMTPAWTASSALPGGDFTSSSEQLTHNIHRQYPWLPSSLIHRYVTQFGLDTLSILDDVMDIDQLGQAFNRCDDPAFILYQCEVDYLLKHEFVTCSDDLLWRRTKLGLFTTPEEVQALDGYIANALNNLR